MSGTAAVLTGALAGSAVAVLLGGARGTRLGTAVHDGCAPVVGATREPPVGAVRAAGGAGHDAGTGAATRRERWAPAAACLLAAAAVALVVAPPYGLLAGAAVVLVGPHLLARLEPRARRQERERLAHDLPLVLDLLASCLVGGAPLPAAAEAVSRATGGPAGRRLAAVGAALAVGAPPGEAWGVLAGPEVATRADDPLGPCARALARAADGGAPVAAAVSRLAADARADARGRAEQAARRVGVLAVAPLGLCFLPAFVLLGVVPVVVGLAGPLLAGL